MCGENRSMAALNRKKAGSPPHVRGKLFVLVSKLADDGITPACAGKTHCWRSISSTTRDHPRMCGENDWLNDDIVGFLGSPPHVRGKREDTFTAEDAGRITPACAGKTAFLVSFLFGTWDHPRMCGENLVIQMLEVPLPGSPPHVRGKLTADNLRQRNHRITPACAGKTDHKYCRTSQS